MQSTTQKTSYVTVTVTMPDGTETKLVAPAKTFKTGRRGYYVQIAPPIDMDGKLYGGQVQLWEK